MQIFRKKNIDSVIQEAVTNNKLKRHLNLVGLIALGVGAIVGTGIFVITGTAAAKYAGPALTISFAISAVGCIMAGLCYAEFASMMPVAGSVYSYCYSSLGEIWAWFVGWILILEYLFACSSVAVGWSGYVISLFEDIGVHLPMKWINPPFDHDESGWKLTSNFINLPAVLIIGVILAFLSGGIKNSSLFNNIIVVIKVVAILLFIIFGAYYVNTSNWEPYIPQNTGEFGQFGWSGIMRGAGVVFYAYLGFDALSTTAQEVKNPQKTMPKGILISLIICAILYILVTTVLTGIVNYKDLDVPAPIALAIDRAGEGLRWLSPLIKLGAVAGLSSVILVMMLGQTRIYYSISKDGLLPPFFSKVKAKSKTPLNSTVFSCVITAIIAGLFPLHVLSELVSIGTLLAFTIVCLSVIVLRRSKPDLHRPFKAPWVPFVPLLGAFICVAQMLALPKATWERLIIWLVLGIFIYIFYGIKHSLLNKE